MKTMRWLISNFFLILLIVAVIYGYMFWGNLAGKDTPAGEAIAYLSNKYEPFDRFVSAVKEKQAKLSGEQAVSEQSAEHTPVKAVEQVAEAETKRDKSTTVEQAGKAAVNNRDFQRQAPVTITYSHNQTRVMQNSAGDRTELAPRSASAESAATSTVATKSATMKVVENKKPEQKPEQKSAPINNKRLSQARATTLPDHRAAYPPVITYQPPVQVNNAQANKAQAVRGLATKSNGNNNFVSTEIEQRLNNVDKHGKLINHSLQSEEVRATWIKARKSFYQRKYALSEQSYQKVIDDTEDNFDAYGELGNVYFNQGKKIQAATAYYEAAAILIRKGQVQRAKSLMGLMRHLDKSKAVELQKLLDSAQS